MTPTDAYLASTKALDDLRAINARFIENFINNDVAAHDALLHPAFIGIRSDGTRIGRADYLKAWWNTVNWAKIAERYAAAKSGTLGV